MRSVKGLPEKQRLQAINDIRSGFRNSAGSSPDEIKKLLKIAEGKLGYIKMITPRTPEGQEGRTKMYFDRDGVHIGGKSIPGRTLRAGLDADDLARHKYLLERQHFMHRK